LELFRWLGYLSKELESAFEVTVKDNVSSSRSNLGSVIWQESNLGLYIGHINIQLLIYTVGIIK
jgi:hypothetical protein